MYQHPRPNCDAAVKLLPHATTCAQAWCMDVGRRCTKAVCSCLSIPMHNGCAHGSWHVQPYHNSLWCMPPTSCSCFVVVISIWQYDMAPACSARPFSPTRPPASYPRPWPFLTSVLLHASTFYTIFSNPNVCSLPSLFSLVSEAAWGGILCAGNAVQGCQTCCCKCSWCTLPWYFVSE